jgi:hypothetical protein
MIDLRKKLGLNLNGHVHAIRVQSTNKPNVTAVFHNERTPSVCNFCKLRKFGHFEYGILDETLPPLYDVLTPTAVTIRGRGLETDWHGNLSLTGTGDDGAIRFARGLSDRHSKNRVLHALRAMEIQPARSGATSTLYGL